MSSIQEELRRAKEEQRLNIPAKRILEKIESIPSEIEKLQRRWFWELLQNASDYNDSVEVKLEVFPDKVVFSHNGKPFKPMDAENLIAPDSGKDDEETRTEDTIGQFGTGFISTHVLSSHITVKGIVKSEESDGYHHFNFELDRSGFKDKDLLKRGISNASDELENNVILAQFSVGKFDTSFIYDLKRNLPGIKEGEAVEPGLEYVYGVLPYTLAFMPKIEKVTIINHDSPYLAYSNRVFTPTREGSIFNVKILSQFKSGFFSITKKFQLESSGDATVIVSIEEKKISKYYYNVTRLFCSLPMIGTEQFSSPIIINSPKFIPKTERDGIRLSSNDQQNRAIMLSAVDAYKKLLTRLVDQDYVGVYNLVKWTAFPAVNSEKAWYNNNIVAPLKEFLSNSLIVRSKNGRIKLGETKLPYFPPDDLKKGQHLEFFDLCLLFMPEKVPIRDDFEEWYTNVSFNVFKSCKYELKELLEEVQNFNTLDTLENELKEGVDWLNRLLKMVLVIDPNLLDQFRIIPNQQGNFVYRKDEIYYDNELDEELIEIYDQLAEESYKALLLHKDFEPVDGLLKIEKTKSEEDLAKSVDDAFSDIPESERSGSKFQTGLRLMFAWLPKSGKEERELRDLFKWFSGKKPQLFLETIPDFDRDKVLSIAQSDKLSSLSRIADSDISKSDLEVVVEISEKGGDLKKLSELARLTEEVGVEEAMKAVKQLAKEQEELQFKKEIGEGVEEVLNQLFSNTFPNYKAEKKNKKDYDILITNKSKPGNYYFIELKSLVKNSSEPIRMGIHQAKKAKENPDRYALVFVRRPEDKNLTEEYLKSNVICDFKIGLKVIDEVHRADSINGFIYSQEDIKLEIKDPRMKVQINPSYLATIGEGFEALTQEIDKAIR